MRTSLSQTERSPSLPGDVPKGADESSRRSSLLLGGLRLLGANTRLLLWLWLASLLCGLLAAIPFSAHMTGYLDHSLAAQQIAGRVNLGYLAELVQQAGKHGAIDPVPSLLSIVLFTLFNFVLTGGTLFVFLSGAPAQLSIVVGAGLRYFWRFVRLTIVAALTFGLVLWLLSTLQDAWLERAGQIHVGAAIAWRSALSFGIVALVALILRFYFDLAETVVVHMGIAGERRVRRSFPVAFTLLRASFFRAFLGYLVAGAIGVALCASAVAVWITVLSPYSTALGLLLGQMGIAALFAGRLWQRASLAFLVLRRSAPVVAEAALAPTPEAAELRTIW